MYVVLQSNIVYLKTMFHSERLFTMFFRTIFLITGYLLGAEQHSIYCGGEVV